MKDLLRNPVFTGIISAIICVLAYYVNNKVKNVENDNSDMMKMGLSGRMLRII